jgi:hypothetical protein
MSDEELDELQAEFRRFREAHAKAHGQDKPPSSHPPKD